MIISKTPFRISFVGGGTDIKDFYSKYSGAVVSAAINKYMYITVNRRFDDSVRVSYSDTEIVDDASQVKHDIVRECLRMTGITHGVEITSVSDIPKGTGLGSSSAFTVGLLNALYLYKGSQLSALDLAEKACEIEIDILGNPIGKQDQYASACGGLNFFAFCQDGKVVRERINLSDNDYRKSDRKLVMFYTGGEHKTAQILAEQKKEMSRNEATMCRMRDQAYSLKEDLETNGFNAYFGELLSEGWRLKRTLAGSISNSGIDELYRKGLEAGALGGKLLGAGGSGFLLFYVDEERQDEVRKNLDLKELPFTFTSYGTRIICCD